MAATWVINERLLRWWGKEHGWYNLNHIALGLGVSPSTLSRAVNGKSGPGESLLASMRLVFGDDAFSEIATVIDPDAAPVTNGAPR